MNALSSTCIDVLGGARGVNGTNAHTHTHDNLEIATGGVAAAHQ